MDNSKRAVLRHDTGVGTSAHLDAFINERGDLVLEGQDLGTAPDQVFGVGEYEYWVTVTSEHKDRVLLALLSELFRQGSLTSSDFMGWLKERDIPYEFFSY